MPWGPRRRPVALGKEPPEVRGEPVPVEGLRVLRRPPAEPLAPFWVTQQPVDGIGEGRHVVVLDDDRVPAVLEGLGAPGRGDYR